MHSLFVRCETFEFSQLNERSYRRHYDDVRCAKCQFFLARWRDSNWRASTGFMSAPEPASIIAHMYVTATLHRKSRSSATREGSSYVHLSTATRTNELVSRLYSRWGSRRQVSDEQTSRRRQKRLLQLPSRKANTLQLNCSSPRMRRRWSTAGLQHDRFFTNWVSIRLTVCMYACVWSTWRVLAERTDPTRGRLVNDVTIFRQNNTFGHKLSAVKVM